MEITIFCDILYMNMYQVDYYYMWYVFIYREREGIMLAKATDEQKDSLKKYMEKIKDIKLRVPEEYLEPIKAHAKSKGMSVNQLVISLLEKDMGVDIMTVREQNKQNKHIKQNEDE